jgi:hypothetical protein
MCVCLCVCAYVSVCVLVSIDMCVYVNGLVDMCGPVLVCLFVCLYL